MPGRPRPVKTPTRYFQVTNPDGSLSVAWTTGHQHDQQETNANEVELTEAEGRRLLAEDERRRAQALAEGAQRERLAAADAQGWRRVAAQTLAASGMPAQAIAAITGLPVAEVPSVVAPADQGDQAVRGEG